MTYYFWFVLAVLAVVALMQSSSAQRDIARLRMEINALRSVIDELRRREQQPATEPIGEEAPAAQAVPEQQPAAAPATPEATWFATQTIERPLPPELTTTTAPPPEPAFTMEEVPAAQPPQPEPEAAAAAPQAAYAPVADEMPPPPPTPPSAATPKIDWESFVGVKLFSWIAAIALALAAVFFFRDAIERGLITPPIRFATGIIVSLGLLAVCELKVAGRYRVTANAMDGAGLAILYATLFAAHERWAILPAAATFVLMIVVTAAAVWLSTRRDSVFIALLGLAAGFATPALLSTGEDRPVGLFSYLLILNIGIAWISIRKSWPLLTVLTFVFTALYQWGWVLRFLGSSKLSIGFAVFLIFPIIGVFAMVAARRRGERRFDAASIGGLTMPLLFALYVAVTPQLGARFGMLFAFLFCIVAGLAAISALKPDMAYLHQMGATGTVLIFIVWMSQSYTAAAWPRIALWTTLFAVVFHFIPGFARWSGNPIPDAAARRGAVAGSLLTFVFPVLAGIEPLARHSLMFGLLTAVVVLSAAVSSIIETSWRTHVVAAIGGAAAAMAWSVQAVNAENLPAALAVYVVFSAFLVSVPLIGRARRGMSAAPVYLALAPHILLIYVAGEIHSPTALLSLSLALVLVMTAAGALVARQSALQIVSLLLAQFAVLIHVFESAPGNSGAMMQVAIGAFAIACIFAAIRRFGDEPTTEREGFAIAALISLFAATLSITLMSEAPRPATVLLSAIAQLLVLAGIFGVTRKKGWDFLDIVAVLLFTIAYVTMTKGASGSIERIAFATAMYLPFVIHPLTLGERARKRFAPYLAAVFAGVPFLFYGHDWMRAAKLLDYAGLLPLAQAALTGLLLLQLLRIEPAEERNRGRLALVAGAVLGFVTVAIPLQFDREWITLGWALEAAALAWLNRRVPHRGLVVAVLLLGSAAFARLALNPAVFDYHPRQATPILNWYLYAYLLAAAALFVAAYFMREEKRLAAALRGGATALLFLLLNIEIADYYSTGRSLTFNFTATLAQDLTYTVAWAIFATALLIAGIVLRNRTARVAALALLVVTIFKCFLHDLGRLGGLYRVGSFVGLAICLAAVALLLQRFVFNRSTTPPPDPAVQP